MVNSKKFQYLEKCLSKVPQIDYPCNSRIHALKSFNYSKCRCFVKRDDELGFGISGSKVRKFRTLVPYLKSNGFDEVLVIGGAYSNNVLGIVQLLIENELEYKLFLRGEPAPNPIGNALWISLFGAQENTIWIERKDWHQVENIARQYIEEKKDRKIYMLSEGSFVSAALPGALTLSLDILRNEKQLGEKFDHIFVDSGTGLTAIGLILAHAWQEVKSHIHVILLADHEASFKKKLLCMHQEFEQIIQDRFSLPGNFRLHKPKSGASFGSVTKQTLANIKDIAKAEGFLTDPIYSAKLFNESRQIISQNTCEGNILIVHSGGGLALAGFQDRLR